MKIEHIAMYVNDLESVRDFFVKYFGAVYVMTVIITQKQVFDRTFFCLMMEQGLRS